MRQIIAFVLPIAVVFSVIVSSCNAPTAPVTISQTVLPLWDQALPKPTYVELVEVSGDNLCLDVIEAKVWEPSEYGDDTLHRIENTTRVEIDTISQAGLSFRHLTIGLLRKDAN